MARVPHFVKEYWCQMNGVGHGHQLTKSEAVLYFVVGIGDNSIDLRNPPNRVELRVKGHLGVVFRVIMEHACVDKYCTKQGPFSWKRSVWCGSTIQKVRAINQNVSKDLCLGYGDHLFGNNGTLRISQSEQCKPTLRCPPLLVQRERQVKTVQISPIQLSSCKQLAIPKPLSLFQVYLWKICIKEPLAKTPRTPCL